MYNILFIKLKTKKPTTNAVDFLVLGNVLLSQDPAVQVPSALKGLTVVFEMGTRGSLSPLSPNMDAFDVRLLHKRFTPSKLDRKFVSPKHSLG